MIIDVDTASAVPAYEQVRSQLAEMISTGALAPGFRLAPIRQLAKDLALAPGTVARVYRELEQDGLVISRVRHGTVVAAPPKAARAERGEALAGPARMLAASAARVGGSLEDAMSALREQWSALEAEGHSPAAD
ncbi:MAG: GntR family transcriptional regulator [Actinomycetia bacterium]|nr:GntR family transcriptional regulator [Actinomycetes bacterium]MDO5502848.1 GntR family transcriptional regulator [Actinomycetes bacterium]